MRVYGYTCPDCDGFHKRTRAALLGNGQLQLKCRFCNEIESFPALGSAAVRIGRVSA